MNEKLVRAVNEISEKNQKRILKSFGIKLSRKKVLNKYYKYYDTSDVIAFYERKYGDILNSSNGPFLPLLFRTYLYNIFSDLEEVKDPKLEDDYENVQDTIDYLVDTVRNISLIDISRDDQCLKTFTNLLSSMAHLCKLTGSDDPEEFLSPYDVCPTIYLYSLMYYLNTRIYSQDELEYLIDLFEECALYFSDRRLLLQMYLFLLELLSKYEPFDKSLDFINQLFEKEFSKNVLVADSIMNIAIENDDQQLADVIVEYLKNKKFFIIESDEDELIVQDIFDEYEAFKNKETLSIPYFMSPNFTKDK